MHGEAALTLQTSFIFLISLKPMVNTPKAFTHRLFLDQNMYYSLNDTAAIRFMNKIQQTSATVTLYLLDAHSSDNLPGTVQKVCADVEGEKLVSKTGELQFESKRKNIKTQQSSIKEWN